MSPNRTFNDGSSVDPVEAKARKLAEKFTESELEDLMEAVGDRVIAKFWGNLGYNLSGDKMIEEMGRLRDTLGWASKRRAREERLGNVATNAVVTILATSGVLGIYEMIRGKLHGP